MMRLLFCRRKSPEGRAEATSWRLCWLTSLRTDQPWTSSCNLLGWRERRGRGVTTEAGVHLVGEETSSTARLDLLAEVDVLRKMEDVRLSDILRHRLEETVRGGSWVELSWESPRWWGCCRARDRSPILLDPRIAIVDPWPCASLSSNRATCSAGWGPSGHCCHKVSWRMGLRCCRSRSEDSHRRRRRWWERTKSEPPTLFRAWTRGLMVADLRACLGDSPPTFWSFLCSESVAAARQV